MHRTARLLELSLWCVFKYYLEMCTEAKDSIVGSFCQFLLLRNSVSWLYEILMLALTFASLLFQGGIYTLPSHLSPGARDLIPRMLLVDPMKRVTILEIRQHTWFLNHLPRYLAVPPPDTTQQAKRVSPAYFSIWCTMSMLGGPSRTFFFIFV